eukprot:symbB.v1.2.023005.t1/scaffold2078.1/size90238/4
MGEGKKLKYDSETKKLCKQAITGSKDWKDKEEKILAAFKKWDKDGNGFISKEELKDVLNALGLPAKEEDVEVMLKDADLDNDGKIDYEEMVHWLCRAPHLEQYFLMSVDLFKQIFTDANSELWHLWAAMLFRKNISHLFHEEMVKIMEEMTEVKKSTEEGGSSPDDVKKVFAVLRKVIQKLQEIAKATEKKIEEQLGPVIRKSFQYHDKDSSGMLTYDESIVFFSNFVALWEPFAEVMSELNVIATEMKVDVLEAEEADAMDAEAAAEHTKKREEKMKLVTPDKLHEVFKQKYAILKEDRLKNIDEHNKRAFEVLSTDGQISEESLVEALLHGHEKNSEFLNAMNLLVVDVMADATKGTAELEAKQEEMEEGLRMMEAMMGAFAGLGSPDGEGNEGEEGPCVWASSTTIYLGYTSCKKVLHLRSPAKPNIRPAFLSGCLWALGFACFAKSLDDIGYTATYMLSVIGPVLVSQLISVFVFKEDTTQLRWFAVSCVVQALGMSCIILGN